MTIFQRARARRIAFLAYWMFLIADSAVATVPAYSLQPSPVFPGQPAYLRIDDADGCYEMEQRTVQRNGNAVAVEIWVSDFIQQPCPPQYRTPLLVPLGAFEAGTYPVQVTLCGFFIPGPCQYFGTYTLGVGVLPRRHTVPALGVVALLLSCSGILALAFTGLRGPSRR